MINQGVLKAQQRFAEANGWRVAQHGFSLDTLARNGMHGEWDRSCPVDHGEYYRKDRRAAAMVGHNYDGDTSYSTIYGTKNITRLAAEHGLIVHIAPQGKRASWYYQGGTTLLVITRPGIAIVWPTEEQMAATAQASAEYEAAMQRIQDRRMAARK